MMIARHTLIIFSEFRSENNGKFMKAGSRKIEKKLTAINEAADFELALPKSTLYIIDNAKYQSHCFSLKKEKRPGSIACIKSTFPIGKTRIFLAISNQNFRIDTSTRKTKQFQLHPLTSGICGKVRIKFDYAQ